MERNLVQEMKVGFSVLAVLALIAAAVFVLGGSSDMLQDRFRLNAAYQDISGLREGAAVRLAGITVGEVTRIQFPQELDEKRIFIQLNVMERYHSRIRKDSVASIQTEGVLGDKYISISVGSVDEPVLEANAWIGTDDPLEILSYMSKATEILEHGAGISRKINFMLGEDKDSTRASLADTVVRMEGIVREVESGQGLLHALIFDERMATYARNSMANLETASASLARISGELENGDGFAHELIYGAEGERLARELGDLAAALQTLTADIQNDNSVLHALIYDEERAGMVEDLHATSTALREVAERINAGEGTAGLLATDPTLYEDLRALVGGAQRNKLLRAYIRQTVEKSEQQGASSWEPVE